MPTVQDICRQPDRWSGLVVPIVGTMVLIKGKTREESKAILCSHDPERPGDLPDPIAVGSWKIAEELLTWARWQLGGFLHEPRTAVVMGSVELESGKPKIARVVFVHLYSAAMEYRFNFDTDQFPLGPFSERRKE